MRITGLEARTYAIPLDPPFDAAWDPVPRSRFEETIVMVHTDEGVTGFAGGTPVPDLGVLDSLLRGVAVEDTAEVAAIVESVDFHGGRNWTVEVAVWDAWSRGLGRPLYEALGATRSRYPAYASTGERLAPEERVERTLAWRDRGIGAVKIRLDAVGWPQDVGVIAAVRHSVGDSMVVLADANQAWRMPGDLAPRWDLATATECVTALEELDVYWLEEPLPFDDVAAYAALRERTGVRIAGGEMVRTLEETKRLIEGQALDVVQNDVVLAGGVAGAHRVARWAADAGIEWSPHTWSTGLGLVANLHVALALSTAPFIEVPYDPAGWTPARRDFMLPEPLELDADGAIAPPPGAGLGTAPDLEALERWRIG